MAKSISVKHKKRGRGRPATGHDPLVGVRMPPELRARIDAWAARQEDTPSLSEAVRRMLERQLAAEPEAEKPRRTAKRVGKPKAD
jgi:Arc/MetJ-type ribon-helix-helix transcriptional regulator